MTIATKTVKILLKEGPVLIPSLGGSELNRTIQLWDGISANEFFPAVNQSTYYILSLEKPVVDADEVYAVERDLISALRLLAMAWPFSGGSFMRLSFREVGVSECFESNADQVHSELLSAAGRKQVSASVSLSAVIASEYTQPPLKTASNIARAAKKDDVLYKILQYYYSARDEHHNCHKNFRSPWFIDLYKVRECLKTLYGSERNVRSSLNISWEDWRFFGETLNNKYDLRHAKITRKTLQIPPEYTNKLFQLAWTWISSHLQKKGLLTQ